MVRITDPVQYASCSSCGRTAYELLRSFDIGLINAKTSQRLTLCTECLGELEKQAILYQPKEVSSDEMDRALYRRRI